MKKIYMILAAMTLLSMSLNAQLLPSAQRYKAQNKQRITEQSKGQASHSAGLHRAPAKINTAEGEFLVGPYTTDYYSTTGKGLYSTTSYGSVEVSTIIPRSDIEQYIGQEIVGYRFATVGGTVSCYSFLVESEGPNYYINDLYYWNIQSDGSYIDLSGNQWHEYYLDEPVVFQIPDTTQAIWIGYKYYQESSNNGSYTMTPIAVNPNVTSYECYAYSYNQSYQGFYDVTSILGGAVAAQLIFKQASTTPTLTAPVNGSTVNVGTNYGSGVSTSINVSGKNLTENLTVSVSGSGFTVSPTSISAANANAGTTVTVTYNGTDPNATGTLTIGSNEVNTTVNLTASYSDDVIICNGTDQNEYLPIYGYWYDSKQINQMIYPESMLADLVGKDITSMTFYSPQLYFSAGKYTVKVGITTQTTFSSPITRLTENSNSVSELKTVAANLVATAGGTELTITFNEPFSYSSGNLLVDFEVTTTGQYGGSHTYFYGENQNSATGFFSRGSSTNNYGVYGTSKLQNFLPKVSFTVESSQPQTAAPTIAITSQTDNEVVITATGNGTVTLTINGQTVEGEGSASITLPRQMQDYNVTASATAQVSGELISPTTTETITVPGMSNDGWTQMTGTYNNPNDLLSFKVKVDNDTTDIMLIDQFMASTVYNNHPNKYTYVLKETIDGEEMSSTPTSVPVYKTNSTMYSLYTEEEVLADNKYDDNKLMANVINSEIDYDVVPDHNALYYSLYRGGKDEETPVIDVDHRISQLQKFEDKVDDNVVYYFNENHTSDIAPMYEHIGSQIVERIDMDYVTGTETDKLSYVPVIWTFGLYTAREDGKNNSYGSDIKESYLGKVDISVAGYKNDGDSITGQWKDDHGTTYCVYAPIITLQGHTPEVVNANDGDTYEYVPYMYRVWCTYENAHNFTHVVNPDGKKRLVDAGPIEAPFLIGEVTDEDAAWNNTGEEVVIGRALESGESQQPWSFGVPVTEPSKNVEFVARFYYKKIVTPAAQVNGLRGNRGDARAFAIAEKGGDGKDITTGISELGDITYVVSRTYVNAQGMQSDVPFDGLNIVITRYSDGTTSTTKVVR